MIALSSFRPFGQSVEYDANAIRANVSWSKVFDWVVYWNKFEGKFPSVHTIPTHFRLREHHNETSPTIKEMAKFAGERNELCCIINADIVVTPKLKEVGRWMNANDIRCGTSRRINFNPMFSMEASNLQVPDDMGLDIFIATPEVWSKVAKAVPEQFKLGHVLWDTWMLQYFMHLCPNQCCDFTPSKCVFHPIHGNRGDQTTQMEPEKDKYLNPEQFYWPNKHVAL